MTEEIQDQQNQTETPPVQDSTEGAAVEEAPAEEQSHAERDEASAEAAEGNAPTPEDESVEPTEDGEAAREDESDGEPEDESEPQGIEVEGKPVEEAAAPPQPPTSRAPTIPETEEPVHVEPSGVPATGGSARIRNPIGKTAGRPVPVAEEESEPAEGS